MDLREYLVTAARDSNIWWKLSSGTHLNLFNEACDEIERLLVFVRDQPCDCYDEYGLQGRVQTCDRCALLARYRHMGGWGATEPMGMSGQGEYEAGKEVSDE
jgi:hypothetical protein